MVETATLYLFSDLHTMFDVMNFYIFLKFIMQALKWYKEHKNWTSVEKIIMLQSWPPEIVNSRTFFMFGAAILAYFFI